MTTLFFQAWSFPIGIEPSLSIGIKRSRALWIGVKSENSDAHDHPFFQAWSTTKNISDRNRELSDRNRELFWIGVKSFTTGVASVTIEIMSFTIGIQRGVSHTTKSLPIGIKSLARSESDS